jgi:hypothetical protein
MRPSVLAMSPESSRTLWAGDIEETRWETLGCRVAARAGAGDQPTSVRVELPAGRPCVAAPGGVPAGRFPPGAATERRPGVVRFR